jgi:hypothetical protein
MRKIAINVCFGGFGLSDAAYEKLIEYGVPVRKYITQEQGDDGLYKPQPLNDGEVIFDRELTPHGEDKFNDIYHEYKGKSRFSSRYWDFWTRKSREHPLIIRVIEELGEAANGTCAKLKIVEVPDDAQWHVDEYDGNEHIAENHRTWP